jgi:hypothetical protein
MVTGRMAFPGNSAAGIAYSDLENGQFGGRNFLLNVDTLETHEFPHDPSCRHEADITFSHSGRELAILCVHNTESGEYLITDLQGKSKRSLTMWHEPPYGLAWSGDDQSLLVAAWAQPRHCLRRSLKLSGVS